MNVVDILKLLGAIGGRVTGSYARQEETPGRSDLDIFVPESKWSEAKKILLDSGLPIESTAKDRPPIPNHPQIAAPFESQLTNKPKQTKV